MDVLKFNDPVKHGTLSFHPKLTYGFEGKDAAPYFKACGWAVDAPANTVPDVVLTAEEVVIDPDTVSNETGLRVHDVEVKGE